MVTFEVAVLPKVIDNSAITHGFGPLFHGNRARLIRIWHWIRMFSISLVLFLSLPFCRIATFTMTIVIATVTATVTVTVTVTVTIRDATSSAALGQQREGKALVRWPISWSQLQARPEGAKCLLTRVR